MAIWNESWKRSQESEILDDKVEEALKPVFCWCIENDIPFEDFHYAVCTGAHELILHEVLCGREH